jgi:hypothetical protein
MGHKLRYGANCSGPDKGLIIGCPYCSRDWPISTDEHIILRHINAKHRKKRL